LVGFFLSRGIGIVKINEQRRNYWLERHFSAIFLSFKILSL
jgi:hypothetical protein